MVNQVINEIFRQMTITLTLPLDVPGTSNGHEGLILIHNLATAGIKFLEN